MRLFVYGYGFAGRALARRMTAKGWRISATYRDETNAAQMTADGVARTRLGQGGDRGPPGRHPGHSDHHAARP